MLHWMQHSLANSHRNGRFNQTNMVKPTGANDSFDALVFAAENEVATIESVREPEDIDQLFEEDEYEFTGSPETVEQLHGLSQKAREDLQAQFNQIEKVDDQVRTKEELEASQRQRGKSELARDQLPLDLLTHFWKDQDLAAEIMRCINLMRRHIEQYPGCVDPGVKRYFKEFGNNRHICTQLGMHFNSGSVEIFSKGSPSIFKTMSLSSRGVLLIWDTLHSPATDYPPLSSFEAGHEKGRHKRGVYLIKAHKPQSRVRYCIGSGRSAKGGMLLRAIQHGCFEYRKENPQFLYTYLNNPEGQR